MLKLISAVALCLTGPALFATSALQTCEALLTAGLKSSRNTNMLMSLRDVQEILSRRAGLSKVDMGLDSFYGPTSELIPPFASTILVKMHKIESALVEPNDSEQIVFSRILRGERAIRAGLLRVDTATKELDLAYKEARAQIRPTWQTALQYTALGAVNLSLAGALIYGHVPVWLSFPLFGATIAGDARAFKDYNYTGFVRSQVAYARVRRTLQKIFENEHDEIAIQTDHLRLPPEAAKWLACEQEFECDERREAYRFNSTGMNRGFQTVPELQDFKVEHIAYYDTYVKEPMWLILVRAPRVARATTVYKVR